MVATGRRWATGWRLLALTTVAACTRPISLSKGRDAGADAAPVALAMIHYLGRFDRRDPAGPRFAWPGTGIAATFEGTGLNVTLADTGANLLVVVVDGGAATTVATSGPARTYTLASNLPARPHTVMLTKRTEASFGVLQLLGLAPEGGALIPSASPFARRIEYLGDSITCGYGDLGDGPACHFTADTEDETVAYGGLAAAALAAEPSVIAYSGKGMYRDYQSRATDSMPVLFDRALPDDPTSAWGFATPPPDVVVINLGSNDFAQGDPGPPFVQAYATFLEQLRRHYPETQVICALPPTMTDPDRVLAAGYLQGVVQRARAAGDARVSTLEIRVEGGAVFGFQPRLASDGWGCDHHPSVTTQRRMGIELAAAIPRIVGW